MKVFGIEIRKSGSVGLLYSDVNRILRDNQVPTGSINLEIQKQTIAHSLQNMMQSDHWLDVTTIRKCAEVCQIVIPVERERVYSACHCISWNKMLADFRELVIAMILDDFKEVLNPNVQSIIPINA